MTYSAKFAVQKDDSVGEMNCSKMFVERIIACICLILFDSEAAGKHWKNKGLYVGV